MFTHGQLANIHRIVIVVGCQRSGTTLTGQILGAHRSAVLIDETDGLYAWFNALASHAPEADVLAKDALLQSVRKYRTADKRVPADTGAGFAWPSHLNCLVLKAPNLTYHFDAIAKLAMKVSIVYPIRDPRAVVASMEKLRHIPMVENQIRLLRQHPDLCAEFARELAVLEDPAVEIHVKRALVWRIKSSLAPKFVSLGLPVMSFRYEDLVAEKQKFCEALASHAGLPFDPQMARHEDVYQGLGPGRTERARPVDAVSVPKWKSRLTPQQEDDIIKTAAVTFSKLGYSRSSPAELPAAPVISDATLRSPVLPVGRGGSGTRLISEMFSRSGIFLGNRLNATADSVEWVDLIYEMAIARARKEKEFALDSRSWSALLLDKARDVLVAGNFHQGARWGWKLPETMVVLPEVVEVFDQAKVIHLVRHPVSSSLRRTHMTSRTDNPVGSAVLEAAYNHSGLDPAQIADDEAYFHNAVTWRYQVERVMRFGRDILMPDRYLEVRYEDLCADPQKTCRLVTSFAGIGFREVPLPEINPNRMRHYESGDERADVVWKICGDLGAQLGYGPFE
ncbi:MAG: sulfotransferase [Rhizobiaceae bacterium]